MARTLQQLKESVERLIEEQGNDAPVAAFVFTNEDVFVMDEDGNPDPVQREIAETVLDNLEDFDHIYTEVFQCIEEVIKGIEWYYMPLIKVAHHDTHTTPLSSIIDSYQTKRIMSDQEFHVFQTQEDGTTQLLYVVYDEDQAQDEVDRINSHLSMAGIPSSVFSAYYNWYEINLYLPRCHYYSHV